MAYKQITEATKWAYVSSPIAPGNEIVVYPVAVWALNDKGDVVGLISVHGGGPEDNIMGSVCRLVAPPPLRGVYKNFRELSVDELRSLEENKPVKVEP